MATLDEMKHAVKSGLTRILTIDKAKELVGKRIATIYFDFQPAHEHAVDEFTIGEIKSEFDLHPDQTAVLKEFKDQPHLIKRLKTTMEIITGEGRRTFLRAHTYNNGIITGPSMEDQVWYKEIETA